MSKVFHLFIDGGFFDEQKKILQTPNVDMRKLRDWCVDSLASEECTDHTTHYYHGLPFVDDSPRNRILYGEAIEEQEQYQTRQRQVFHTFERRAGKFTWHKGRVAPRGSDSTVQIASYQLDRTRPPLRRWVPLDSRGKEIHWAQKEIDVKMAIDIIGLVCRSDSVGHIAMLTGDSDFIPVIEELGKLDIPFTLIYAKDGGKDRVSGHLASRVLGEGGQCHVFTKQILRNMTMPKRQEGKKTA